MSKTQIVAIVLLIIGTASFGYLAYGQWQKNNRSYSFQGYVSQVNGNKFIIEFPVSTLVQGKTVVQSKQITVDTNFLTTINKINAKQQVTSAKLSDIGGQADNLQGSQVVVFSARNPKDVSELWASKVQITKDFVPFPPGSDPNHAKKK